MCALDDEIIYYEHEEYFGIYCQDGFKVRDIIEIIKKLNN
jgi:hypothetical protein